MAKPSDQEIAARAYKLWEQNGQPEGRDEEFWRLAEQELLNEDKSSPFAYARYSVSMVEIVRLLCPVANVARAVSSTRTYSPASSL